MKEVGTGHRRSLVLFLFMFFGFILFQEKVVSICLIFLMTAHINLFCVCNNLIDILICHISFFFLRSRLNSQRAVFLKFVSANWKNPKDAVVKPRGEK